MPVLFNTVVGWLTTFQGQVQNKILTSVSPTTMIPLATVLVVLALIAGLSFGWSGAETAWTLRSAWDQTLLLAVAAVLLALVAAVLDSLQSTVNKLFVG